MPDEERCLACVAGFDNECYNPTVNDDIVTCCCPDTVTVIGNKRGGPTKSNEEITDVLSTGRKRAAVLFPLDPEGPCEWRGLKFAGGGAYPIVGCLQGKSTNRHHGPDKSVLNNTQGNVHRICSTCHNRWHSKNDAVYGDRPPNGEPFVPPLGDCLPHDPITKATDDEIKFSDFTWAGKKLEKAVD